MADYYGLLGLKKSATDLEIKKAFKRMAIQLLRSLKEDECVEELFYSVAEAYDVLSNDLLRAVYDQYGREGLVKGVPTSDGFTCPYVYHGDFMRTYEEFFGSQSPFADLLDYYIHPLPIYDLPEGRGFKNKQDPLIRPVYCTLEEIYQGCVKKMKISRQELISEESQGLTEIREKILDVPIKPGMLEGTEICFPEEGDQGPTIIPADIVFKVTDRPHKLFVREGINLAMTVNVTLLDALVGANVKVTTLDGRILRIPIHDVITPTYEKVVLNEGMPIVENPDQKGDLIMRFQIGFPTYLPRASKNLISKALNIRQTIMESGQPENLNLRITVDKIMRTHYDQLLPSKPRQSISLKPCKDEENSRN